LKNPNHNQLNDKVESQFKNDDAIIGRRQCFVSNSPFKYQLSKFPNRARFHSQQGFKRTYGSWDERKKNLLCRHNKRI